MESFAHDFLSSRHYRDALRTWPALPRWKVLPAARIVDLAPTIR